jgi:hypothetical protein
MKLRDRIRRWWSPAQWEDDHPAERKQQDDPNKNALGGYATREDRRRVEENRARHGTGAQS